MRAWLESAPKAHYSQMPQKVPCQGNFLVKLNKLAQGLLSLCFFEELYHSIAQLALFDR